MDNSITKDNQRRASLKDLTKLKTRKQDPGTRDAAARPRGSDKLAVGHAETAEDIDRQKLMRITHRYVMERRAEIIVRRRTRRRRHLITP